MTILFFEFILTKTPFFGPSNFFFQNLKAFISKYNSLKCLKF